MTGTSGAISESATRISGMLGSGPLDGQAHLTVRSNGLARTRRERRDLAMAGTDRVAALQAPRYLRARLA